jgi:hypothetical protein
LATWDEDSRRLFENLTAVLDESGLHAQSRKAADAETMRLWHARTLRGLRAPTREWVGCYRGSECAADVEVFVPQTNGQRCYGSPASRVRDDVAAFVAGINCAVAILDTDIPPKQVPSNLETLEAVIALSASAHARWIRIHPFVNGNGRTARLWANWVAIRYGLPRFVSLRPRPAGDDYADAGRLALCSGDPTRTVDVFRAMYLAAVRT